ncbi:MAG: AraC family transcriptional regulator [Pseudomonadales bacterium]|uniref:AraC family transcriptional regulator n=1 Tax=Alcanivorax sp. MD8A TaxID=1177157 RepID=UPI001E4EDE0F|nr:AraC family transcriptional regulator [Alcanivorax sp. MD8A]MCG8438542.1 AraC family transcriptional regulator [Pseudomonadales bacterium]
MASDSKTDSLIAETRERLDAMPGWISQQTQSSTYPRAFLAAAEARGADRAQMLADAGLDAQRVEDPEGRLSLREVWMLAAVTRVRSGDPTLGFACGDSMPLTAHGNLGYALLCAGTPREAVGLLQRFWHLRGRGVQLLVNESDNDMFMELVPECALPPRLVDLMFSSIATSMFRGMEFLIRDLPGTAEIWLQGPAPDGVETWQARLPTLRFSMPRAGIHLVGDLSVMDQPLATANPEGLRAAVAQCERESALSDPGGDVLRRVRAMLLAGPDGYPSPVMLAERLHMTPRTFRRRLQEQGFSYQQLLEEARRRDSCQLLRDPEREIRRISDQLGYLNPANFTRAFKSWTGMTPREWRQQSSH